MKKKGLIIAIYAIVFAIYNVLTFVLCKKLNNVFWCSYGFMITTYIVHVVIQMFFSNEENKNKQFVKGPMLVLSLIFVLIQLIINVVFMDLKDTVGMTMVATVHGICFAVYVIAILVFLVLKNNADKRTDTIKQEVVFIKGVCIDIEMMIKNCSDDKMKKTLNKLHDVVMYSDPMSNKYVEDEEDEIMENMVELKTVMSDGDFESAKILCDRMNNLFEERNKKILATK